MLLVDEAQSLSNELLEELRMLTNIETDTEKLVTLVLVGQPQLADRLNDERLGQLKQRVELRCTLSPFDIAETVMYIKNRVRIAGGDAVQMFTRGAIQVIHERSRGIPRSISVICENALVGAFAENQKPVTRALVEEICDELDLSPEPLIADEPEAPVVMNSPVPAGNEVTMAPPAPTPQRRLRRLPNAPATATVTSAVTAACLPPSPPPDGATVVGILDRGEALVSRLERALRRRDREMNPDSPQPEEPASSSPHDGDPHIIPIGVDRPLSDRAGRVGGKAPRPGRETPVSHRSDERVAIRALCLPLTAPEVVSTGVSKSFSATDGREGRRRGGDGSAVGRTIPAACRHAAPGAGRARHQ